MKRIYGSIVLLCASAIACSTASSSSRNTNDSPIVFGEPATTHPETVLVSISKGGTLLGYCSGSVVSPYVVLTAGHCVDGYDGWSVTAPFAQSQTASSALGVTLDYKGNGESLNVSQHDLGLVILSSPITLATYPTVATAPVPDGTQVVSFGRVQDGTVSTTTIYQGFAVPIRDAASIGAPLDYYSIDEIQSGDSGGPVEVVGNGGAPLIVAVNSASYTLQVGQADASTPDGSYELLARTDLVASWIAQQIAAYPHGSAGAADAGAAADAGTVADAGAVADGGASDAAASCYANTTFTAQTWAPPTPLHQNKCTAAQITAFVNSLSQAQGPWTSGAATCDACLMTDETASAHGPVLTIAQGGKEQPVDLNWGGCQADVDGQPAAGSCGNQDQNLNDCIAAECANCGDYQNPTQNGPTYTCEVAAINGGRCAYSASCEAELQADGGASACSTSLNGLLTLWCGQ